MNFYSVLDLTDVFWKANTIDGTQILQGHQTYPKINRNNLESFELFHKGKSVFKINTVKKTLIHRLKTTGQLHIQTQKNSITTRVRVTALLYKNKDTAKNTKYEIKENKKIVQEYEFDPEESVIYYHYEDGKDETRNKFSIIFPYTPIKLRPEELSHLNG